MRITRKKRPVTRDIIIIIIISSVRGEKIMEFSPLN
jgi:hypothetical protein